jgi:hypothetical protein
MSSAKWKLERVYHWTTNSKISQNQNSLEQKIFFMGFPCLVEKESHFASCPISAKPSWRGTPRPRRVKPFPISLFFFYQFKSGFRLTNQTKYFARLYSWPEGGYKECPGSGPDNSLGLSTGIGGPRGLTPNRDKNKTTDITNEATPRWSACTPRTCD